MNNYLVLYEAFHHKTTPSGAGPQAVNFVACNPEVARMAAEAAAKVMVLASGGNTEWRIKSITYVGYTE
jgi:hypothetical protein